MKFLGRRAMEVATNTIVMVIVAVVVLALSLTLTYNVMCSAEDYQSSISSQNRAEINRLLASSGRVVVPNNAQDARVQGSFMCGSSRTQAVDFALGIQNREAQQRTFDVKITRENPPVANYAMQPNEIIFLYQEESETVTVQPGESFMTSFVINLPLNAPKGQYQYQVRVEDGRTLHGAQIVYVTVR